MSKELASAEVETALTTLFERIDGLETKVDSASSLSETALTIAQSAKSALANIHTVPTNGNDVILGILGKATAIVVVGIITWGIVQIARSPELKEKETK